MSRKALVLAFVFFLAFGVVQAREKSDSTDASGNKHTVQLESSILMEPPRDRVEIFRESVQFPHLQHSMDYGCRKCHHNWDISEQENPSPCITCHNDFETTHGEGSYFGAFHSRQVQRSCVGCHYTDGGDVAPLKCPVCH